MHKKTWINVLDSFKKIYTLLQTLNRNFQNEFKKKKRQSLSEKKSNVNTLFLLIVLGFTEKRITLCGKRMKEQAEKTTFLQQETTKKH